MILDYQCVTEEAVASSRLLKARQYGNQVWSLRRSRQSVPTDESTSIRNCGDAYDGIRPGRMIVKFRGWPRDMAMQMRLWHIGVAEPPC